MGDVVLVLGGTGIICNQFIGLGSTDLLPVEHNSKGAQIDAFEDNRRRQHNNGALLETELDRFKFVSKSNQIGENVADWCKQLRLSRC
jgi:hypothetical protein